MVDERILETREEYDDGTRSEITGKKYVLGLHCAY